MVYTQCAIKVSLAAQFVSHNEGAGINTLVSAGKQQCLHLFSFQNNEVYVVHAVQLVQLYIVYASFIVTCGSVTTIAPLSVLYLVLLSVIIFFFFTVVLAALIVALTRDFLHVFCIIYIIVIHHFKSTVFNCCLSHNFYIVSVVKLVVCKLCLD